MWDLLLVSFFIVLLHIGIDGLLDDLDSFLERFNKRRSFSRKTLRDLGENNRMDERKGCTSRKFELDDI